MNRKQVEQLLEDGTYMPKKKQFDDKKRFLFSEIKNVEHPHAELATGRQSPGACTQAWCAYFQ
jgi:hypothetical protein